MKTFLVGKIGKSIKFNSAAWSASGDNEAPSLIKKIAELNPADKFIIISKSDYSSTVETHNLPKNLHYIYFGATIHESSDFKFVYEKLKNEKIDGCFIFAGPNGPVNIPDFSYSRTKLKDGVKIHSKTINICKLYVAPIYYYLNNSNIKWVLIANDPRYIKQGNDLLNLPKKILSQYDEDVMMQNFDNIEDQNYQKTKIYASYSEVEKIFSIDKVINTNFNRNKKFMIVLNEGNNGVKSRFAELKKYVLNYFPDVEIYGKWSESIVKHDDRFKGALKFNDMQRKLKDVKYTFIIPIKPGWVTSKYIEMISNGIIPFFHPDYDSQLHINVPDFIRIKSTHELIEKINFLENNNDEYLKIIKECQSIISEDDISGRNLSNIILNSLS